MRWQNQGVRGWVDDRNAENTLGLRGDVFWGRRGACCREWYVGVDVHGQGLLAAARVDERRNGRCMPVQAQQQQQMEEQRDDECPQQRLADAEFDELRWMRQYRTQFGEIVFERACFWLFEWVKARHISG